MYFQVVLYAHDCSCAYLNTNNKLLNIYCNSVIYIYVYICMCACSVSSRGFCKRGHNGLFKILGVGGRHVVWACEAQIPRGGT